ncbi:methyl-accepting chemotaxis protein [Shewanella nanhaiensis]|uniref:Methyl-accepting chemotaxis protein n=1 Tax=Shewanella nanhaiensis TaxID=2864872 RepID=A0ABS7E1M3_9GAMM|nr:methyl-accepting chemotaxis protein [Shewanella nanhaiensis]MBW8183555.1 methyl-accepting chemotaxis protein [Shewanella nanhaiensis]
MKHLPISTKLLWITSGLFLSIVTILSVTLWWALDRNNAEITAQVQETIHQETQAKLEAKAGEYGQKVAGFINEAYRIPYAFSGMIEESSGTEFLTREGAEANIGSILRKNSQLSSMYAQFEPDGFDGNDAHYMSGTSHSVEGAGSLELYFVRNDDGSVTQESVDDANEKYADKLNEFGLREAEWYLCARDSMRPCLMEPYLYEISPGNNALMTSLTVPVIKGGKFSGLVGVDLNLPIFQQMIEELSGELFQGKAKVTLLSSKGLIVAASHYDKKARPLKEALPEALASSLVNLAKGEGHFENSDEIAVAYPIEIPLAASTWSLVIEVPKEEAFKPAILLNNNMQEMANALGRLQLSLGVIVSLVAVFSIWVVIRSIISPLKMIQSRVECLASAEGDLTQSIEVESHAELIALGSGFNAFITKLRLLIVELKQLAGQSQEESLSAASIAKQMRDSVDGQNSEIESVVTAVNQMSAAALEVAKASEQTATETDTMSGNVKLSEEGLTKAMAHVTTMSTESNRAKEAVGKVSESSDNISTIVEVIRSIAEQTNLLALNAAIEAARAGEQGRGFAVVADEVRALASKTQASTDDITQLINSLQSEVSSATNVIESGAEMAKLAVAQTESALVSINAIVGQIDEISSQVTHIAAAAEEQSTVTEEVNKNITGISDSATELSRLAGEALNSSDNLADLVKAQHEQLGRLNT